MFVITGATGHTGHAVAETLLGRGRKVRVLGRSAAKLAPLVAKGAEAFPCDMLDVAALTAAFRETDGVYAMIPPDPTSADVIGSYDRFADALVAAIKAAGVEYVVALSSYGAHLPEGTGPILGVRRMELKLNTIHNHLNVLHLRPAGFMENTLAQIPVIQKFGAVAGIVKPDVPTPMIATKDIGVAGADELERREFKGIVTRELLGPRDITMSEVTKIIGGAIGQPDLSYMQPPVPMFTAALQQSGMSADMAELVAEMSLSINSGKLKPEEERSARNTTPTTFETFAAEVFAPAFHGKAASA